MFFSYTSEAIDNFVLVLLMFQVWTIPNYSGEYYCNVYL